MISVITPVFNAEKFLDKTIESVLSQEEVHEHLLIDDGSTDGSWDVIKKWATTDSRIIPLRHADRQNHGRSATRNLGLRQASCQYIAFLDADDLYLSNRFKKDLEVLQNDSSIEGVYNAIGAHYYLDNPSDELKRRVEITTVKERIPPSELFYELTPFGRKGYFSGDGLIVRHSVFEKTGYFNERLRVAEDSDLWKKMALLCNLVAGEIDVPVALRGVHNNNVFSNVEDYRGQRVKMYIDMLVWAKGKNVSSRAVDVMFNQLLLESIKDADFSGNSLLVRKVYVLINILRAFCHVPNVVNKNTWLIRKTLQELN